MEAPFGGVVTEPSTRERNVELAVRVKLNTCRAALGCGTLPLHEGLVAVARAVAHAQRSRARVIAKNPSAQSANLNVRRLGNEVRALLAKLALPPGFVIAHFHFSSDELPRIFG